MLVDELKKMVRAIPADLKEKKGVYSIEFTVAERKVFLSKKKLTYSAKFRVDEERKELRFTEMLKEASWGMSSGDSGFGSGFGFRKETFRTGVGPREGTIHEQSVLFGKQYKYKFDFAKVRTSMESEAVKDGYAFKYQATPIGL